LGGKIPLLAVRRLFWVPVALALAAGCGKKGPPLAPIVRIPAAIDQIAAQRVGRDVFVTLTVPAKNVDASIPADISRIEVYGYTGRVPPSRARWVEIGALIAVVPVAPPVVDAAGSEAPKAGPGVGPTDGATPGTSITVLDTLTQNELVQGPVAAVTPPRNGPTVAEPAVPEATPPLRRYYAAFGFSARGRPGPPGTAAEFAVSDLPEPPTVVRAPYSERSVSLEWSPSGGVVGFLFERPLLAEEVPLDEHLEPVVQTPVSPGGAATDAGPSPSLPSGPTRYNVYRDLAPDLLTVPISAPLPAWSATRPAPLNAMPLELTAFADPVELDRPRCYIVRAVRGLGAAGVEGEPSLPTCMTPTDVFPPGAPARLVAIGDQGGISLVWEPNSEPDLAGYLVLRGEATDATLQSLTSTPVVEPRFRDTRVTAGTRYVYVVVAVDGHLPVSNVSAESNRVEETAR
jgi:hypothetical protein